MKRSFKLENPYRNTIILLAVIGFCASSTLLSAVLCLVVASLTFSTIIVETMFKMRKKPVGSVMTLLPRGIQLEKPSSQLTVSYNQSQENLAVRRQLEALMSQVGQKTNNGGGQLPAPPDDPRMVDLPKLRQSPKAHV